MKRLGTTVLKSASLHHHGESHCSDIIFKLEILYGGSMSGSCFNSLDSSCFFVCINDAGSEKSGPWYTVFNSGDSGQERCTSAVDNPSFLFFKSHIFESVFIIAGTSFAVIWQSLITTIIMFLRI